MNAINNAEDPEIIVEMEQERERQLFKQKQTKERDFKYNELNNADSSVINSHYHDDIKRYKKIIVRMLTLCDFVNSGSYSAKYSTTKEQKKFNNMLFLSILENMVEDEQIKVKQISKFKYYYLRLSKGEVENMSEEEIKSRMWQNNIKFIDK